MVQGSTEIDVAAFHAALSDCPTIPECKALLSSSIDPLGFDTYACGEVDLENRERVVMFAVAWPEEWLRMYLSNRINTRDPLLDALAYRTGPFTWGELRADRELASAGSDFLNAVAGLGWIDGLVVPIARTGARFGLVSLVSRKPVAAGRERLQLATIAALFHARVRFLAPREGFPIPPFGLTARELECLGTVADGLSDRVAGDLLGISVSTAHEYVESAKRKLKARSRAQAVAIAMSFGLLAA